MLKPSRIVLAALAVVLCEGAVFAQAPTIAAGAVVNAASFTASLSPGSLAAIFGQNLSTSSATVSTTPWPTTLGGAQVSVGGKSAALDFASPTELIVQIPVDVAPGYAQVAVTVQGKGSASATVTLASFSPGIYTSAQSSSTQSLGVILHQNSSTVTEQSPAQPGEVLQVYAVGLGPTNPSVPTGATAPTSPPLAMTITQPTVTVGCQQANVVFSGLAPSMVGSYLVNFTLPASAPGGNLSLTLSIGGQTSNTVTLPVAGPAIPVVNAVVNGASFATGAVAAPGTMVSIFGCNFGSKDNLSAFPATNFQGISATFNAVAGPLFAVAALENQINVLVPTELPGSGTVTVQVQNSAGLSASFSLKMSAATPGIFYWTDPSKASRHNGAVLFANTAWDVMPASMATAFGLTGCAGLQAAATCGQPAGPATTSRFLSPALEWQRRVATRTAKCCPRVQSRPPTAVSFTRQCRSRLSPSAASPLRFYSLELLQAMRDCTRSTFRYRVASRRAMTCRLQFPCRTGRVIAQPSGCTHKDDEDYLTWPRWKVGSTGP